MWAERITSSASVRWTNALSCSRTWSGSPTAEQAVIWPSRWRSAVLSVASKSALGGGKRAGRAGAQLEERLLGGGAQQPRLLYGIGCEHVEADHDIGCVQLRGSHEVLPVGCQGLVERGWRKVRGERIGQPQQGRQLGAVQAGPQNPQRHPKPLAGDRVHLPLRTGLGKVVPQFHHVPGKLVDVPSQGPPQRMGGDLIGARRPADAEVDAPGVQGLQGAELLGNDQRCMVRQHHPAGAHADGRGAARDVADDHGGGGAGDAAHVVVLRHPIAPVAPTFGVPGEVEGVGQRLGRIAAFDDGR